MEVAVAGQLVGGNLSREQFTRGFARWYRAWAQDPTAGLTEEQLRAGLNKELPMLPPGGGSGFPGGPPAQVPGAR